jgi:hypothetical protein
MNDKYDFLMYERAGEVVLDPLGTLLALLLVVVIGLAVANTRLPRTLKRLVYAALAMRVVGAVARYVVLFRVYAGSGDARGYYSGGIENAAALWRLEPMPILDPATWWNGKWWGTQFVHFPSTLVHTFIGPSMPGGFLVFSLFAFVGLCGFVVAFGRAYPEVPLSRYARWVWFFPALWYWPSSIGKEAIVLLGLGLAVAGYVGREGRIHWLLLVLGVFFVFAIRPEVAAVVILSIVVAHWLSLTSGRWTLRSTVQAAVLIGGGLAGIFMAMKFMGIEGIGPDAVQDYMEGSKGRTLGGGSAMDAVEVGLAGVPLALVNILLRPFPWEASSLMILISCLEIMGFWAIVWVRRGAFARALRHWRHDRLLRVAIPFIAVYSVTLGMVMANMGIIARQRIFLFPFLFLLVEAVPRVARRAASAATPTPTSPAPPTTPVPAVPAGLPRVRGVAAASARR